MIKYYEIDEDTARMSKMMNSHYDYRAGSATKNYRDKVDHVYELAEKVLKTRGEEKGGKAFYLADRYAKKLADYYQKYYRNECNCPSILVSGPAGFSVAKKEKQNSRRETLHDYYDQIEGIKKRVEGLIYGKDIISSGADNALEDLQIKAKSLQDIQDLMKNANAYFRKNGTLNACPDLTEDQIKKYTKSMKQFNLSCPFTPYSLASNRQNLKRVKERIIEIEREKSREPDTDQFKNDYFQVVENSEIMRLQLIFDGKPEEHIRAIVKRNGFKWAPSQGAWQRLLNANARYALDRVLKELEKIEVN